MSIFQPKEELLQLESVTTDVLQQFERSSPGIFVADCRLDSGEAWIKDVTVLAERNCAAFNSIRKNALRKGDRTNPRFNFLIQDDRRPKVATTVVVTEETLVTLDQRLQYFASNLREIANQEGGSEPSGLPMSWSSNPPDELDALSLSLLASPIADPRSTFDTIERLHFLGLILSVGIASYAGSHCGEIIPCPAPFESAEELRICQHGKLSLICRKRKLSCLDQFIGGPTWIFTKPNSSSNDFILSMTVAEFADLWGPLWGIEADDTPGVLSLFTERGEIIEVPSPATDCPILGQEIPCHWKTSSHVQHLARREEIQESLANKTPPSRKFSATSSLLIGMPTSLRSGFLANQDCPQDFHGALQQGSFDATLAGSHRGGWELNTRAATITGGHFINFGATQTHRSVPASTMKDRIYAMVQSARSLASILPIMRLHVGLEISICTGNAERVSLWEALKLSCITSTQRYVRYFWTSGGDQYKV